MRRWWCALALGWAGACGSVDPSGAHETDDPAADSATDPVPGDPGPGPGGNTSSDDHTDDDTDGDTEAPVGATWTDPSTGLTWQDPAPVNRHNWAAAASHCSTLAHGGHTDWRLPNLSELRSLIRGCAPTETGGSCPATDDCATASCWSDTQCIGCVIHGGGGHNGCYADPALSGNCDHTWSATSLDETRAWHVDFARGQVSPEGGLTKTNGASVRCVRG